MSLVAVLSQPLRQSEAATFLRSSEAERKLVITRYVSAIDVTEFPSDTEFFSWSPSPKPPPSSRMVIGLARLKRWVRGGSGLGVRIDRSVRSAEWRLRYLDRILAVVESRKDSHWDLQNPALVEVLNSEVSDETGTEIAVFDLFDLPAVLSHARDRTSRVVVR